ncbi:MAG: FAD-dependent oxidoreductase, partial [Pseudomonadota bacterium]
LAWEGYHYWRDWAAHLDAPEGEDLARYVECGCLVMRTKANGYLETHVANSRDLGIPLEDWDADRIRAALPGVDLSRFAPARRPEDAGFGAPTGGRIEGAVLWPNGGYMTDPALSAKNLADAAGRHGAVLRLGAVVEAILTEGGRAAGVRLAGGEEVRADVVVNVAGPASAHVNEMAGVTDDMTIRTRPLRQEVTHLPAPPDVYAGSGMVLSDSDACVYSRPEHGGNVLIGSEDPPCDVMEYLDDDTVYDRDFTDQWNVQAMRMAQRFPSIGIPSRAKGVVDLYDASTDWIPIYDRSSLPGFYMACGTSGNQYKNAPIAGVLMAQLIEAVEGGHDHDAEPLRMTLPYVGREIGLGFYSRKRAINAESSFSVLG